MEEIANSKAGPESYAAGMSRPEMGLAKMDRVQHLINNLSTQQALVFRSCPLRPACLKSPRQISLVAFCFSPIIFPPRGHFVFH